MTVPALLLPGAMSRRIARPSALLLYWRAADGRLDALTGQAGTLELASTGTRGQVVGVGNAAVTVGDATPRFTTAQPTFTDNRTLLAVNGEGAPTVAAEQFSLEYPAAIDALTFYLRLYPNWTPGATRGGAYYVAAFGTLNTSGGDLILQRTATAWSLSRSRQGVTKTSNASEGAGTAAAKWPLEILGTLTPAGAVQVALRTADAAVVTGALSTADANLVLPELFNPARLYLGSHPTADVKWDLVKVARGAKTWAEMEALA